MEFEIFLCQMTSFEVLLKCHFKVQSGKITVWRVPSTEPPLNVKLLKCTKYKPIDLDETILLVNTFFKLLALKITLKL